VRAVLLSPAVLRNDTKYEVFQSLVQHPRTRVSARRVNKLIRERKILQMEYVLITVWV
jgi:hypothetical protein